MPTFQRSINYKGSTDDYDNIVALFSQLMWPAEVQFVYITNGWHQSFEVREGQGKMVTYCGYCCNIDNLIYKQHYYLD